jgi:hypothetical protein
MSKDRPSLNDLINELAERDFGRVVSLDPESQQSLNDYDSARLALENIFRWILADELASNESMYDQVRYDMVYEILNQLCGCSRVTLHQEILEVQSLKRNHGKWEICNSLKDLLSREQKEILMKVMSNCLLKDLKDAEFSNYLRNKIALKLGLAI